MATRTILFLALLAGWGRSARAEDKPAEEPKKDDARERPPGLNDDEDMPLFRKAS